MSHTIKHYKILAYLPKDRLVYSNLSKSNPFPWNSVWTSCHRRPAPSHTLQFPLRKWYQQFSLTNFWNGNDNSALKQSHNIFCGIRSLNNTNKVHFVQTEIILQLCYTSRSCFVSCDFFLHDFALAQLENLHHFSHLHANFWFNTIWHRQSVAT